MSLLDPKKGKLPRIPILDALSVDERGLPLEYTQDLVPFEGYAPPTGKELSFKEMLHLENMPESDTASTAMLRLAQQRPNQVPQEEETAVKKSSIGSKTSPKSETTKESQRAMSLGVDVNEMRRRLRGAISKRDGKLSERDDILKRMLDNLTDREQEIRNTQRFDLSPLMSLADAISGKQVATRLYKPPKGLQQRLQSVRDKRDGLLKLQAQAAQGDADAAVKAAKEQNKLQIDLADLRIRVQKANTAKKYYEQLGAKAVAQKNKAERDRLLGGKPMTEDQIARQIKSYAPEADWINNPDTSALYNMFKKVVGPDAHGMVTSIMRKVIDRQQKDPKRIVDLGEAKVVAIRTMENLIKQQQAQR